MLFRLGFRDSSRSQRNGSTGMDRPPDRIDNSHTEASYAGARARFGLVCQVAMISQIHKI